MAQKRDKPEPASLDSVTAGYKAFYSMPCHERLAPGVEYRMTAQLMAEIQRQFEGVDLTKFENSLLEVLVGESVFNVLHHEAEGEISLYTNGDHSVMGLFPFNTSACTPGKYLRMLERSRQMATGKQDPGEYFHDNVVGRNNFHIGSIICCAPEAEYGLLAGADGYFTYLKFQLQ